MNPGERIDHRGGQRAFEVHLQSQFFDGNISVDQCRERCTVVVLVESGNHRLDADRAQAQQRHNYEQDQTDEDRGPATGVAWLGMLQAWGHVSLSDTAPRFCLGRLTYTDETRGTVRRPNDLLIHRVRDSIFC